MSKSQQLKNIIKEKIASSPRQRITFAEYMALCLYHPHYGYYSSGAVKIGAKGDYFTSASLGADFGELLAGQFVQMWEILGNPISFTLVEMGAGQGELAQDILNHLAKHHPSFFDALEYLIVEESPALIQRQQELLKPWHCVKWVSWEEIPQKSVVGCFFSNELLDAFPVHQITIKNGQLEEIYVTVEGDRIGEISDRLSTSRLKDYFQLVGVNLPNPEYPENYRSEVNLAALDWLQRVVTRLKRGYIITIDYGYSANKYYHPQRFQGTLQCFYQHKRHSDPYLNIGDSDITCHVDFTAIERQGELLGLETIPLTKQGLFLMGLGLGERLAELSSGQHHIKEILQRRDALHQLIDPSGLGNFGVLIQSKGLNDQQKQILLKGASTSL
jgi:SAM-dependent MidA family methyltransferase